MIEKLKQWLSDHQKDYVIHSDWNGDTENGFYTTDEFDIEKLMESIDKFHLEFQKTLKDFTKELQAAVDSDVKGHQP